MKNFCFALVLLCNCSILFGQASREVIDDVPANLAETITIEDLKEHLTILASDEFEGRETGSEGNRKAQEYISNHFKNIGLPTIGTNNSYYQPVMFTWTMWEEAPSENDMELPSPPKRGEHQHKPGKHSRGAPQPLLGDAT